MKPEDPGVRANKSCYSDYYDKPSWWFAIRYDTQVKRKTCLELLRRGGKKRHGVNVFELGFGSGSTLFSFSRDCSLAGVEISPVAVERAKARAQNRGYAGIDLRLAEGNTLPWPDSSQDIVIASHVLEHVPDDAAILREIARILRPDGIAVSLVPINERFEDPKHIRSYTPGSLDGVALSAGLEKTVSFENERLYHFVDRFYSEGWNARWRVLGPLIVLIFNLPSALLPWWILVVVDFVLGAFGMKARQYGAVFRRTTKA